MLVNDEGWRKKEWTRKVSSCILDLLPVKRKEWGQYWAESDHSVVVRAVSSNPTGNSGTKFVH